MKKLYGITIILLVTLSSIFAQTTGRYRVSFADKKNSQYSIDTPQEFLSEKAIARRSKQNISYSIQDIPVNQWYIDSILACGAKLCNVSKWFNSAIFVVDSLTNISKIQSFSFVKSVEWVAPLYVHDFNNAKLQLESIPAISYNDVKTIPEKDFYGDSYNQIALMNGIKLHKDGFMGQGMTLAIIDAGFLHVDSASSFVHLWKENRVIGVRDFSGSNVDVFTEGYHGMACFSLISSFIPGKLVGTAPRANFYLLHSEEGATEYKVEEDNWTAAAEFADSVGVDVISTSFNLAEHQFGINLITSSNESVVSVLGGTVVYAAFTFDFGWVIQVQHENNYLSVYKNNTRLLKKVGDEVKAGESIAITGDATGKNTGSQFYFELWKQGKAVNPEDVIIF